MKEAIMDNYSKMDKAVDVVLEMLSQWSDEKFSEELQKSYDGDFSRLLKVAGVLDLEPSFENEAVGHMEKVVPISNLSNDLFDSLPYINSQGSTLNQNLPELNICVVNREDGASYDSVFREGFNLWMTKIA